MLRNHCQPRRRNMMREKFTALLTARHVLLPPGRRSRPTCTSYKQFRKRVPQPLSPNGCLHLQNRHRWTDVEGHTLPWKLKLQQSRGKSSANTSPGKRKVRQPEPMTMDYVSSSLRHDSDSCLQQRRWTKFRV